MQPMIARPARAALMQLSVAAMLASGASIAAAQVWTPLSAGARAHSVEVLQSSLLPVPPSILAKGGTLRVLLVGGGEGGHASRSACDEPTLQAGKGGDGGEVVEFDIPLVAGQCAAGLVVTIGEKGRGALRAANATLAGETGGTTSVACNGTTIAYALGGGRRPDPVTAARGVRGGAGAFLVVPMDATTTPSAEQRPGPSAAATSGQAGHLGYGSGGGGGGVAWTSGPVVRRQVPLAPGGHGAGAGAGPMGYAAGTPSAAAQNAAQYGAGGGGGGLYCGPTGPANRDGGNGAPGYARVTWNE